MGEKILGANLIVGDRAIWTQTIVRCTTVPDGTDPGTYVGTIVVGRSDSNEPLVVPVVLSPLFGEDGFTSWENLKCLEPDAVRLADAFVESIDEAARTLQQWFDSGHRYWAVCGCPIDHVDPDESGGLVITVPVARDEETEQVNNAVVYLDREGRVIDVHLDGPSDMTSDEIKEAAEQALDMGEQPWCPECDGYVHDWIECRPLGSE